VLRCLLGIFCAASLSLAAVSACAEENGAGGGMLVQFRVPWN
jgi:hypothetical protein